MTLRSPCGTATAYKRGCHCAACREAKRIEMAAYVAKVRERDGLTPTQKYRPGLTRRQPGECSKCGKWLTSTTLVEPTCATCRGNRPGYSIKITPADRRAIYDRDGWSCQICMDPVDTTLSPNDTWAATLDHIVPRAQGGTDDAGNLRLAHRWCNSVRGDTTYYDDGDLRIA